jgi:hypothetical protein
MVLTCHRVLCRRCRPPAESRCQTSQSYLQLSNPALVCGALLNTSDAFRSTRSAPVFFALHYVLHCVCPFGQKSERPRVTGHAELTTSVREGSRVVSNFASPLTLGRSVIRRWHRFVLTNPFNILQLRLLVNFALQQALVSHRLYQRNSLSRCPRMY